MDITFYGAAQEVTGSKHLVTISDRNILLDCGMYQGSKKPGRREKIALPFNPRDIDAVIISHAHFDHVGLLPVLVQQGFAGPIYASGATRDLTELILLDAAKIQIQDAAYYQRHRLLDPDRTQPLYSPDDIPAVMRHFETLPYAQAERPWTEITPGVEAKLYDAGHILGSSATVLQAEEQSAVRRLVYTGDLGRWNRPLLRDPEPIQEAAEVAISESTYGQRLHHPGTEVEQALVDTILHAISHRQHILVPAFSLGRTQQLIYTLHWLTDQKRIPRIPIVIDSPLAARITETFRRHQHDYDEQSRRDFIHHGEDPLSFRNLRFTHSVEESKALNSQPGPLLIISASGMATGGRVIHHLRRLLPDPQSVILFTGFQAAHTLGRRLVSGTRSVRIFGQTINVKANIRIINDLSAHADASQIDAYLSQIESLQKVFLVHGEVERSEALQSILDRNHPDWDVTVPKPGEQIRV